MIDYEPDPEPEPDESEEDTSSRSRRGRWSNRSRNRLIILASVVVVLGIACVVMVPLAIQRVRDSKSDSGSASKSSDSRGEPERADVRDRSEIGVASFNPTERKLVGRWEIDGIEIDHTDLPASELKCECEFRSDGTFRMRSAAPELGVGPSDASGTWSARDNTLTLKIDKETGPDTVRLDGTRTQTITITSLNESRVVLEMAPKIRYTFKRKNPAASSAPPVTLPPPDMSGDGPDWTYLELLKYLRSKGMTKLRMTQSKYGQLYIATDTDENVLISRTLFEEGGFGHSWVILCNKKRSTTEAKEESGKYESGSFHWGRFSFRGRNDDDDFIAMRKILTGR